MARPPHRWLVLKELRRVLESVANQYRRARRHARAAPTPERVLEGIGALVVEAEAPLDEDQLAKDGHQVLENRKMECFAPVRAASVNTPDFWHLEKIKVEPFRSVGLDGTGVIVGVLDSGIYALAP